MMESNSAIAQMNNDEKIYYGILQNTFEAVKFMTIKDACLNEFKQIDVSTLKPITIIEASKLYSRGSTTGRTCNCQGKCATETENEPNPK